MTPITITLAVIAFFFIPIASSALARQLHFMLGLQGEVFNIEAIFGRLGFWLLMDSNNKLVNLFKDAVTCIHCLTHHIALIETIVAYTVLFGAWGGFAILIVPGLALIVQNYLQKTVYSQFYSDEVSNDEVSSNEPLTKDSNINQNSNDGSN